MLVNTVLAALLAMIIVAGSAADLSAQVQVFDYREINSQENLADHPVDLDIEMGMAMTSLGDLDGDGIEEIVAGAKEGLYIIFPDSNGFAKSYLRINGTYGGFTGALDNYDEFGYAVEAIGDLDNDGMIDLAVGAPGDDDGIDDTGAVWILFLNTDCTVKSYQKISSTEGGFTGTLDYGDHFGSSLAALGDHDGDGVEDLAVGAKYDDDGGGSTGAFWILFLNTDGTVKSYQKVSDTEGDFTGTIDSSDYFGCSLASLGDLDNDGVGDIAVGANGDSESFGMGGAVWILFMNSNGTVKDFQKIGYNQGGFTHPFNASLYFGTDLASPGDINGDGAEDLLVGAYGTDSFRTDRGTTFVLLLTTSGTVSSYVKIDGYSENWDGVHENYDRLGSGVTAIGDINGDGVTDMAVGAYGDNDCISHSGSVWVLKLSADGNLQSNSKISCSMGGMIGMIDDYDYFGSSVAAIGDWDGNGVGDIAVGARNDTEKNRDEGSVWILFLNSSGSVDSYQKISAVSGDFQTDFDAGDLFGCAVDSIGDLDGDGYIDLVVGASMDDNGDYSKGAVYILFMNADHKVKSYTKISDTSGGFTGTLPAGCRFGLSTGSLGDLDGDGYGDIAVGAIDNSAGENYGALWILFLNPDGTVKSHQEISYGIGGFSGILQLGDNFGSSVAHLGDLDGDSVVDLAVGAPGEDDDPYSSTGAVWILFMNSNGTVKSHQKINSSEGGFPEPLIDSDFLGTSVARAGDLDGDGLQELIVGMCQDDDGGINRGGLYVLFLDTDGTVRSHSKISSTAGNFSGYLSGQDYFGYSVAGPGDIDGNGIDDIVVGALIDDNVPYTYYDRGSVWTLMLEREPSSCDVSLYDVDFGIVEIGSYVDTTFTITNTGGDTLSGVVSESCENFSIISGGGAYSIIPDHSLDVTVRYEPLSRGIYECTVETGDAVCSDVLFAGVTWMNVTVATDPAGLSVSVNTITYTAPYQFETGAGYGAVIGTDSLQVSGDTTFVFSSWNDGGALSHSITTGAEDTTFTVYFDVYTSYAVIDSIVDVPWDQGEWVRIHFRRSVYDAAGETQYPISGYNIYRRVSGAAMAASVLAEGEKVPEEDLAKIGGKLCSDDSGRPLLTSGSSAAGYILYGDRLFMLSRGGPVAAPPGLWEVITSIYATQQDQYLQLAPTQADSSAAIPWEAFYISAHTTTPSVFFESPPDSGYSVDNIAPGVPLGLSVAYNTGSGNELAWDPAPEENFQYYCVYRGTDESFVPGPGNLVHQTADPQWTDPAHDGSDVYYKVTALDDAGNESGPASASVTTDAGESAMPEAFALGQNVPNPFNPSTTVYYDVPSSGGEVSIRIFDVSGRLVRTLVEGQQAAGSKTVTWNGTNDRGQSVSSGIYFYRMTAPGFTRTRKMVLLR